MTDQSKLRIYVQVPQSYLTDLKIGMTASFTVPEHPDRTFAATVAALSQAVNVTSGTFTVQLQADNTDGSVKPGDYAQVKFDLPTHANVVEVPSSALIFGTAGMQVATVGRDGRAILKVIKIGRDYGTTVEVQAGVTVNDKVIDNPPDSLRQGDPGEDRRQELEAPARATSCHPGRAQRGS